MRKVLNASEAAAFLGCNVQKVRIRMQTGDWQIGNVVPAKKNGKQWKWKKDEKTNTYLDEPVPFFDDAMAMLRYSIEDERKQRPRLNRNLKGGI